MPVRITPITTSTKMTAKSYLARLDVQGGEDEQQEDPDEDRPDVEHLDPVPDDLDDQHRDDEQERARKPREDIIVGLVDRSSFVAKSGTSSRAKPATGRYAAR